MKTKRWVLMSLLLLVLLSGVTTAGARGKAGIEVLTEMPDNVVQLASVADETGLATIPNTEVTIFHSEITGQDYRIYVALPPGYSDGVDQPPFYPVVYSLDGNWHFGIDAQASRSLVLGGEMHKMIIVSIGYPTDVDDELMNLRAWDMLPHLGAPQFLGFFQQELIPYIDETYRTAPQDRTLAGHSYGGLFTLYTLFTDTDTFDRYMAMSPALWYGYEYEGQRLIFDLEEAYAAEESHLPVQLYLSVGEFEPEEDWNLWMVSNLIEFNELLEGRNYKRLDLDMTVVKGLGHAGSYPGAFTRGLVEVND